MTQILQFNRKLPIIKLDKKIQIDLGCGKNKQSGFVGIDIRDCGQEIVWDVREGIPFPDNSVDMVYSSHTMEHFDDGECEDVLREIYRILKPGGTTMHIIPHADDPTAHYFDHKTFWNEYRIATLSGVPGLEGFEIVKNELKEDMSLFHNGKQTKMKELLFILRK